MAAELSKISSLPTKHETTRRRKRDFTHSNSKLFSSDLEKFKLFPIVNDTELENYRKKSHLCSRWRIFQHCVMMLPHVLWFTISKFKLSPGIYWCSSSSSFGIWLTPGLRQPSTQLALKLLPWHVAVVVVQQQVNVVFQGENLDVELKVKDPLSDENDDYG